MTQCAFFKAPGPVRSRALTFDDSLRWFGDPKHKFPHLTQWISDGVYMSRITLCDSPMFVRAPAQNRDKRVQLNFEQGRSSERFLNKNLAQFYSLW